MACHDDVSNIRYFNPRIESRLICCNSHFSLQYDNGETLVYHLTYATNFLDADMPCFTQCDTWISVSRVCNRQQFPIHPTPPAHPPAARASSAVGCLGVCFCHWLSFGSRSLFILAVTPPAMALRGVWSRFGPYREVGRRCSYHGNKPVIRSLMFR